MIKLIMLHRRDRKLPKKSGEYLCKIDGEWIVLHYSTKFRSFNCFDYQPLGEAIKTAIEVHYWAKLPEEG